MRKTRASSTTWSARSSAALPRSRFRRRERAWNARCSGVATPRFLRPLATALPAVADTKNKQPQSKQAQFTGFGYRYGDDGRAGLVHEVRYQIEVRVVGQRREERHVK